MVWGRVTLGGVELRETLTADESTNEQAVGALKVIGQESHPPQTRAEVVAAHHNLLASAGLTVPVVFSDKSSLTGFYRVTDARSSLFRHANGAVQAATWELGLEKIGGARDVEVESRVPTIGRLTALGTAPVFWHAPAVGHDSYWTGPTVPGSYVDRPSADGVVRAYLGIPTDVAPRWTAPVESYLLGAARIEFDGIRRIGRDTPPLSVWVVHNGLVRVTSGPDGAFAVSCWSSTVADWVSATTYAVQLNGLPLDDQPEVTVLRNDPEEVIVRLTYPSTPGRITLDLSVRRGARFVTGLVKRHAAATLGVKLATPAAATAVTGGVRATAADADGNRWVLGSASAVTADAVNGGLSRAATTRLDFYAGHEVGAGSATAGDTFADLLGQYLGTTGERAKVVRR